ncbi:MAG: alcohol dehydrogenase [Alphaproteobacteria bacterium]|nr:alcohol dehydrogenase [Alphaproteobacteria bacterium]
MKAVQIQAYGGPEVVEIVDIPTPEPGPGEVLVKAHTFGLGYPDVLLRTGVYKWKPDLPSILGNEMSGHIEALGKGVSGLSVGQPVLVFGTGGGRHAEYNAVNTGLVTPLPSGVDLEAAVSIPNYLVGWAMLHDVARTADVKSIYVNGAAGGMGTAILDICRDAAIETIAGASSDEKCAFAAKLGTAGTVDYTRENIVEKVHAITNGRGVDISFDQLGGPALVANLDMLAPMGLVILYNALSGAPDDDLYEGLRARRGQSLGVQCFSLHAYDENPARKAEILEALIAKFAAGAYAPPIFDRLPLSAARRAHELMDDRTILGKLLLKP